MFLRCVYCENFRRCVLCLAEERIGGQSGLDLSFEISTEEYKIPLVLVINCSSKILVKF